MFFARDYPEWPTAAKPFFTILEEEGIPHLFFNFREESYLEMWKDERDDVIRTLGKIYGAAEVGRFDRCVPLRMIANAFDNVCSELTDMQTAEADAAIAELRGTVEAYLKEERTRLAESLKRGTIEFEDLALLFEEGEEIITSIDGEAIGGIFKSSEIRRGMGGTFFIFKFESIHNLGSGLQLSEVRARVAYYKGFKKISDLPIRRLTPTDKAALILRGELYRSLTSKPAYMQYIGQVTRYSWMGDTSYRSVGRVMIDTASFRQVDSDQWNQQGYAAPAEVNSSRDAGQSTFLIADEDLWRTYPYLFGFSFSAKQWGRIALSTVTPISWRLDAWDKLVLDDQRKELIKALVQNSDTGSFEDLIDGKGGGTIFMLDGPPGQGKTLTAETVAEVLQRPLYAISVGELGTNPDVLEQRLRQILDVAMIWNAVLLLDEADIFLEARNESDIVRNAMVGVFLRLLEYHQGVLFLTTNRVKNIDEAFLSRISVSIHFDEADHAKRTQVWTNLLMAAKLYDAEPSGPLSYDEAEALAHYTLNGRQIKNVIRQVQTLARARSREIDMDLFREVIAISRPQTAHHLGRALKRSFLTRLKDAWGALLA